MDGETTAPRIAWLGRPPEGGTVPVRVVQAASEVGQLTPAPDVLVIDRPGEPVGALLTEVEPLREVDLLLVVDSLDAWEQARALELRVQCLPRGVSPQRRDELLVAALRHAAARRRPDELLLSAARSVTSARFVARTLEQAEGLATLLAHFCPEPQRRVGGFLELLINAIEHGNLEITGPEKRQLLEEGRWHLELLRRLDEPKYAARHVRVTFARNEHGIEFSIEDDGAGFDAAEVLKRELAGNDTQHGRGIALARMMSFDDLVYEGRGNRLVGRIR